MERDGWWWADPAASNRSIKRGILREMLAQRFHSQKN
jgi:glutamate-1-semialdehyde 2,1-aminomutase